MSDSSKVDVEGVAGLIEKIRARAAEHRAYVGVSCQSESSWHADECDAWADELEAALASRPVSPLKRYDLVTNYRAGSSIEEMERVADGEWVRYEDAFPEGVAPRPVEPLLQKEQDTKTCTRNGKPELTRPSQLPHPPTE